ncbi:glycoside hydrolase family 65 protein [Luteimonas aquatica]|uniref:glycoside hydrolase family 65 protein n=1 Tax=Luteimonas aquatica TaxID=450364 RepID=UPI001F57E18F|nr:glycosyl hydrolase family 65 protein [Luteimonas aquatica]
MNARPADPAHGRQRQEDQDRFAAEAAWSLRQTRFDPGGRARDESLFALANGSLGVRGNFEESVSPSDGCFLAGVYERHPIEFHERLPGFARNTDTRVPVADGKHIALLLDGEPLDTAACEWLEFERTLDLREGRLRRRTRLRTPQGATLQIDSERLVALDADVLGIRYRVSSIDYTGTLTLASTIRTGQRPARQGDDPRIGVVGSHRLDTLAVAADARVASLAQRTRRSCISLCCAQAHRAGDDGLRFLEAEAEEHRVVQRFRAELRPGQGVTLEKFVAYAHGEEGAGDAMAPAAEAIALALRAAEDGYAALSAAQSARLSAFWRDADIEVAADPRTELSLRFNLFHLLQSAGRDARNGTAAKGLTGEGYEGHCFWDTEVFVLPVMLYTAPEIARAMLGYRYRRLDAARANAREMNHPRGALYPWRTIAGAECSAHYPSGSAAYHINADIAYAIGLYLDATGDTGFLLEGGAEMLFETARIWPQAGHFDPLRGGAFGIHDVTGPDEYTALVDNNFYTNRMAQRHLLRAVAVWEALSAAHPEALRELAERLSLTRDEIELWRRAAEAMQLPADERLGIFAQDDTFLHKPRWDLTDHSHDRPLLLDFHPLTLYRHQVCKQADVVMALCLAGDGFDAARKRRSFDYYEAITTHDSTLSPAIHGIVASELGLREKALHYFTEALRVDLDDLHGNTDHGVHMAAMAGSWLGVAWGFAGLRVVEGGLRFAPTLPQGWQGYRFGLHWRGRRLRVHVSREGVRYRLSGGEALRIGHGDGELVLRPDTDVSAALHVPGTGGA